MLLCLSSCNLFIVLFVVFFPLEGPVHVRNPLCIKLKLVSQFVWNIQTYLTLFVMFDMHLGTLQRVKCIEPPHYERLFFIYFIHYYLKEQFVLLRFFLLLESYLRWEFEFFTNFESIKKFQSEFFSFFLCIKGKKWYFFWK